MAYEMILKVDPALEKVHSEHRNLLNGSIELKTGALEAAKQAIYFVGIDIFNFEQELTNRLFTEVLPVKTSGVLIQPFLPMPRYRAWSPVSVFAKQRIEKTNKEVSGRKFSELDLNEEEEKEKKKAILRSEFKAIGEMVLGPMLRRCTLGEIIEFVRKEAPDLLQKRMFYHFWLVLHQKSPLVWEEIDAKHLLGGLKKLMPIQIKKTEILELKEILKVQEGFEIQNMIVRIQKGEEDAI